jgi:hypothetical protein
MSKATSRTSNHSITLQQYSSSQSVASINRSHQTKEDTIPTSARNSNLFDHQSSDNNIRELLDRLSDQQLRLTRFYDVEIERRQTTPQLITFLNKIDQLINEYESQVSTNLIIGNQIKK